MSFLQCPRCGNNPINLSAKFCLRDGSKLVAKEARCPCGAVIDVRFAKFCEGCGKPVSEATLTVVEV
jgi:hypothetical protein